MVVDVDSMPPRSLTKLSDVRSSVLNRPSIELIGRSRLRLR